MRYLLIQSLATLVSFSVFSTPSFSKLPLVCLTQIVAHPALDKTREGIVDELKAQGFQDSKTLILSTDNMKAFKTAEEFGYYCSAIDPESYSTYDRETFIDTLNDWGYFGEISNTPKWYSGQAWQ